MTEVTSASEANMPPVLYLADRTSPAFESGRTAVDVVCAGDSITGWNNFGVVGEWPVRTYPQFLARLCEPLGLAVVNAGIAGEVSPNGLAEVRPDGGEERSGWASDERI
jgi:hypothetical protein